MPNVRIWTLEPDHDAEAIKRLVSKLATVQPIALVGDCIGFRYALPNLQLLIFNPTHGITVHCSESRLSQFIRMECAHYFYYFYLIG